MIYANLTLLALIVIYVVDVSGFTKSWRSALSRALGVKALRPLPPFDCGSCATWWSCIIFSLCAHRLCLGTIAFSALLSLLAIPFGQLLIFIRESLIALTNKLIDLCSTKN